MISDVHYEDCDTEIKWLCALRLALRPGANFSRPLLGGPQRAVVEQPPPACGIVLVKPILFWPRLSGFNRFVCQYNELDAISIVQ